MSMAIMGNHEQRRCGNDKCIVLSKLIFDQIDVRAVQQCGQYDHQYVF